MVTFGGVSECLGVGWFLVYEGGWKVHVWICDGDHQAQNKARDRVVNFSGYPNYLNNAKWGCG